MHYVMVSFSHKNTTSALRERLAFVDDASKRRAMQTLNAHEMIHESMILSTCNRVEVLCCCSCIDEVTDVIVELISVHARMDRLELRDRADILEDEGAIHHLFSVASSLDSMIIGETQITGQLKDAFRFAHEEGFALNKVSRAIHYAFRCAAQVRSATAISAGAVSIAGAAVETIKIKLGSLSGVRALVIGSGEMSLISAKHLKAQGAHVTILNRTLSKAQAIADECGVAVLPWEELAHAINTHVLLFSATSSAVPIITDRMIQTVPFDRYWFDMAIPRDIECTERLGLYLHGIDDLKEVVNTNLASREGEAKRSYGIVRSHVAMFFEWLKSLSIEPLIKQLYLQAHEAAHYEAQRVMDKGYVPAEYEYAIQKATEQALKRFLHPLSSRLRNSADAMHVDHLIASVSFLLADEEGDEMSQHACVYYPKGK